MNTKTVIDLLRHGEPEGGHMYRGGGVDHVQSRLRQLGRMNYRRDNGGV